MEQREQLIADMVPIDPSVYSVGPNASIPEESFDESEDVRSWEGGSTDFSFDATDDRPLAPIELPEPVVVEMDDN